jgi:hypothetical protein
MDDGRLTELEKTVWALGVKLELILRVLAEAGMEVPDEAPRAAWGGATIADVGGLRSAIVRGIDATLEAPWIISRWITEENRRLLRAQRAYWSAAADAELQRLLDAFNKEP